jgi:hypothetical protein
MRRLPEELYAHFEGPGEPVLPPSTGVCFRILGSGLEGALIFVGLFPSSIPQGRPVTDKLLTSPGTHHLAPVPDGCYRLMAAGLPRSKDPLGYLPPGVGLRVGRASGPVAVRARRCEQCVAVALFASLLVSAR